MLLETRMKLSELILTHICFVNMLFSFMLFYTLWCNFHFHKKKTRVNNTASLLLNGHSVIIWYQSDFIYVIILITTQQL